MTRDQWQCATMRGTRLSRRREYFDMERGAGGSAGERALEQAYYKARGRKPGDAVGTPRSTTRRGDRSLARRLSGDTKKTLGC